MAKRLGAKIMQVTPGYLSTIQARARDYRRQPGVRLAPFGVDMPEAIEAIASAARATGIEPDEVWCASGSGVLARGLAAVGMAVAGLALVAVFLPPRVQSFTATLPAWQDETLLGLVGTAGAAVYAVLLVLSLRLVKVQLARR